MEVSSKKNINYTMKLMYAFGILFVVSGHVTKTGGISLFYEWFPPYSFHLALFAFCSGYFYKEESEKKIGSFIYKKAKKFLLPLYIFNLLYGILVMISRTFHFSIGQDLSWYNLTIMPIVNGQKFNYNLASWFLVSLFLVQCGYVLLRKILGFRKKKETIVFLVSHCLGFLGIFLASKGYNKGFYLTLVRCLYFLPFYSTGYLYKKVLEKKDNLSNIKYFFIILIGALIVTSVLGYYPKYTPSSCNNFKDGLIVPFIVGYLGVFFWLRICKILTPFFGKNKYVNLLADHAMPIVFHQFMGFMFIKTCFALGYKYFGLFQNFSMKKYKSDIWYYYIPKNNTRFLILYVIAGITIPILFHQIYVKIRNKRGHKYAKEI